MKHLLQGCCWSLGLALFASLPGMAATASPATQWLRRTVPGAGEWEIGGQVRVRYEARNKAGAFANRDFVRGLANDNDYLAVRTLATLAWKPEGRAFSGFVALRDSQVSGDARAVTERDRVDLHEAWVKLGDPEGLSLQLGRQEMIYGDQRFIGNSDWSNTRRSFDAARVHLQNGNFWIDAFGGCVVIPRDDRFNRSNRYDRFGGVYASSRRPDSARDIDFFLLVRDVGSGSPTLGGPGPREVYTLGTRWKSLPRGPWDYSFEVAAQAGRILQAAQWLDLQSHALAVAVGRSWKDAPWSPRLGFGYDHGSGDSNPADDRHQTFELLFGTNHRFYGNMDLIGLRNIHIPRVEVSLQPRPAVTLALHWLGYWLADTADFFFPESGAGRSGNGYGRNPQLDARVGSALEFLFDVRLGSWGILRAGAANFFAGPYIRQSVMRMVGNQGAENAQWFYLQGTATF